MEEEGNNNYRRGGCGLDKSGSGQGLVAGSCEHGDESSSSMKCGRFLDQLSILSASEGGLCFMQ
jgi:hypothetical protein